VSRDLIVGRTFCRHLWVVVGIEFNIWGYTNEWIEDSKEACIHAR